MDMAAIFFFRKTWQWKHTSQQGGDRADEGGAVRRSAKEKSERSSWWFS